MAITAELKLEIVAALKRSGYMLESRVVRALTDAGFFVEPNVAIVDRRTGKSREVDLVAEYYEYDPSLAGVSVRTRFTIEAINNLLPIILITPHPNSPMSDIEGFLRYRTTPPSAPFITSVEVYDAKKVFDTQRYSQYCALSRKKSGDELLASHPDDLYSSFQKLGEFVEQQISEFDSEEWPDDDGYWRLWFWQPVLVLGGDLLVASEEDHGELTVTEVDMAPLLFNFHVADQPRTVVVQIVREQHLLAYTKELAAVDHELAKKIRGQRGRQEPAV